MIRLWATLLLGQAAAMIGDWASTSGMKIRFRRLYNSCFMNWIYFEDRGVDEPRIVLNTSDMTDAGNHTTTISGNLWVRVM